jgi:2-amino-4-hydroxy-6-hydroxymethyldihydropteridine diphosphokinase
MSNSSLLHTAYLALGSNLGNRASHLKCALKRLSSPDLRVVSGSAIYESRALILPANNSDDKENPDYLNCVFEITTSLTPERLLERCLQVELELGRVRDSSLRWQPRTIDIDILLYSNTICETSRLTIPHPELQNRDFVLTPLLEIHPEFIHPLLRKSGKSILENLKTSHIMTKVGNFPPDMFEES